MSITRMVIFVFSFIFITNVQCQSPTACTNENVQSLPGKWIEAMKGSTDHSISDFQKEKILLSDIVQTIRSNFKWEIKGGDITFNRQVCNNEFSNLPISIRKIVNASEAYLFFSHYFCSNGKISREDFNSELNVFVNQFPFGFTGSFFNPKKDKNGYPEDDPENNVYWESAILPQFKNGIWDYNISNLNGFRNTYDSGMDAGIVQIIRFICKTNVSPFVVMNKKEYLENWNNRYKFKLQVEEDQISKIKNAKDPNFTAEMIEKEVAYQEGLCDLLKKSINNINDLLHSTSNEVLSEPARRGEENGTLYLSNENPVLSNYILKFNPTYFNNNISKVSPQLFVISFKTANLYYGEPLKGESQIPDKNFVEELKRMNVFDILTLKLKLLLKN